MKSNKNAFRRIILSLLVIALCVSSAAATFALFTSGGKDGALNTVITAGSVEAIIVDEQGESLVGKQLTFVCADDTREELLWEPGAKFHTQGFRVRNDGDVPMNYRMYVSGGKTYEVTLSIPEGSASGYIAFRVGEEVYLSPFVSCKAGAERFATFKIAVNADNTVACFTPRWGIYSGEKSVENGGVLTI